MYTKDEIRPASKGQWCEIHLLLILEGTSGSVC